MEHVETDSMWRVIYGTFKDTLHTEAHFVPDPHMEHIETDSVWRVIYISVWRVIYISIVVRQTMTCWRQHFPLLCVKQWHADVSTFHCCGQTMVCWCQHSPLCISPHRDSLRSWSTYGACINRLCVESDLGKIMFWIRKPDPLSGSSPTFNGMVLG